MHHYTIHGVALHILPEGRRNFSLIDTITNQYGRETAVADFT